jgi:hypothetical protein
MIHEERPKSQANKKIRADEMEYVIVQVTPEDISKGQDKAATLMGEGWTAIPSTERGTNFYTGREDRFYMQKPKALVEQDRKKRFDEWQGMMTHSVNQKVTAGSIRSVEIEDELTATDHEAMKLIEGIKQAANG